MAATASCISSSVWSGSVSSGQRARRSRNHSAVSVCCTGRMRIILSSMVPTRAAGGGSGGSASRASILPRLSIQQDSEGRTAYRQRVNPVMANIQPLTTGAKEKAMGAIRNVLDAIERLWRPRPKTTMGRAGALEAKKAQLLAAVEAGKQAYQKKRNELEAEEKEDHHR